VNEVKNTKQSVNKKFNDYWDKLITYNGRGYSTDELFYASGDSTLTSTGEFDLTATGCNVKISGKVEHYWHDIYDFHPGLQAWIPGSGVIPDSAMDKLRKHGYATTFTMSSTWWQHLNGNVQITKWWFNEESWEWQGP